MTLQAHTQVNVTVMYVSGFRVWGLGFRSCRTLPINKKETCAPAREEAFITRYFSEARALAQMGVLAEEFLLLSAARTNQNSCQLLNPEP